MQSGRDALSSLAEGERKAKNSRGLGDWLDRRGYASVGQMKGSMSQRSVADPTAFERANYIRTLESFRPPR